MPTTSPTIRGSTEIHLQANSPRFKRDARGAQLTLVFRGPFEALQTYGPEIGDMITLSAFGFSPAEELVYAESVECQPLGAGRNAAGELTIVYSNEGGGGTVLAGEVELPTYEIDTGSLEKRLEAHPRYNNGAGSPFAPYGFTAGTTTFVLNSPPAENADTVSVAEFWEQFKTAKIKDRPTLRGSIPPTAAALLEMVDELTKKFSSGIESFVVPAPVARKTSRSYFKPTTGALGKRGAPAGFIGLPAGYVWLKTADRAQRQGTRGKWERVEEWTGADKWDSDLYPAA